MNLFLKVCFSIVVALCALSVIALCIMVLVMLGDMLSVAWCNYTVANYWDRRECRLLSHEQVFELIFPLTAASLAGFAVFGGMTAGIGSILEVRGVFKNSR